MDHSDILWSPKPEAFEASALTRFAAENGFAASDYESLHRWSISDKGAFWASVWDFCGVVGDKGATKFVPDESAPMTGARFFPDASLNLAENMLRGDDERIAVCTQNEAGEYAEYTLAELKAYVARVAAGLRDLGVKAGDPVAGVQTNDLDALVATLAALSIGAVWTSCSPDFGAQAIIDRIGQVRPKVLFATSQYRYAGKVHDISDRLVEIKKSVDSIEILISSGIHLEGAVLQSEFGPATAELKFERVAFDHPAYVLYTSGTTGAPKAIVHRTGGVLLQHLKEHVLHGDVAPNDRVIWYTNTAWMMYHWMISVLAAEATVVLYDGAPILKNPDRSLNCAPMWDLIDQAKVTHFGTSPKYMATLASEGFAPATSHDLASLKAMFVCGAPCLPHQFDWAYEAVKSDMLFASISGGTEILGSFLIGSPLHPVRRGQLTVPALGQAVDVLDDRGASVIGQRGDLVCTEAFPSMPLTFWGEGGMQRYLDTYFSDRFEIWTHGDVAEWTVTGGAYVHGRSDNTLKPGGVRIGISEIYAVCESFEEFDDFLVFGATHDGDEEVVLTIKLAEGKTIDEDCLKTLRTRIRSEASPRHVPARIHLVQGVPYTINGKRVESAARSVVAGQKVKNLGSLSNPECLDEYQSLRREDAL